ncbi:alpha/beta hydrolase [Kitasatospora sp. NPDC056138]|uniref:alpha/beta hydrolase n=1 Tax=Kitasatospora sp. NPDC056138 TaxID=3345724 RepID=UPI0035DEF40E
MPITNRTAAALAAATAVLSLAAPGAQAAPDTPTANSAVSWGSCQSAGLDPRQRCATVPVPLDYSRPHGEQITLAVSRIPSERPDLRRGVLLMIPGGPGGSGIGGPSDAVRRLPQAVRDAYDIVGFDPRGVGRSTPVSCDLTHEDLAMVNLRPWPAPDGGITRALDTERRIAAACAADGGPVLRSISTRNEARDIDRIRQALGERKLSTWGVSYGTYAGAVYATMFPQRTDRVVLDSNDDPDPSRVERGWLANFAVGAEDRFPDFARFASAPGGAYRIAGTPQEVRQVFLDLADRLDREPIPWPGANPEQLTGNVLRETMLESLYSDAGFPRLATLMLAALHGTELPAPGGPPDAVQQNTVAASVGTLCNDVSWPGPTADYQGAVTADRAAHPLTAGMPVDVMPCAFWPAPPAEAPTRITPDGPSNVLLVQNLRDPATPYRGALKLRAAFGTRARMVAVDSGGHDAYAANGNACGDRLVTEFLVDGHRPGRDVLCR